MGRISWLPQVLGSRSWPGQCGPDLALVLLTSPLTQTDTRSNKMPAKDQGFTEDQIEDFKEVFQLFDTKGDGLIQVTQVGEVLRALGTNPTEGEVKKLVQSSCQNDKDARVTFEMFLPMLQDVSSKPIRDTVDDFVEGLKHFDKEGNGLISAVELRHLLTGLGEKMSEEEVELLIHGKEDSQGNINYEEFVKMVLAQ